MKSKQHIAIFGGAFDPPTNAHFKIAKLILQESNWADEVWFMPAYNHRDGKQMVSYEHRLNMLNILVQNEPNIFASIYEGYYLLSGKTFELMARLVDDLDDIEFAFVMGTDRADNIEKFYNYRELLNLPIKFIVISRDNGKNHEWYQTRRQEEWYMKPPHIYLDLNMIDSSSLARLFLQKQIGPINSLIDPRVLKYINENSLYVL